VDETPLSVRAIEGIKTARLGFERLYKKIRPGRTPGTVEYATLNWADWFNHRRLPERIGNMSQVELEQVYCRQLKESAMVA